MKIAVVKLSGKTLAPFETRTFENNFVFNWLKRLRSDYEGLIIVHGAGQKISLWSEALGYKVDFINGQRITSEELMDVVAAVQSGVFNTKIVAKLNSVRFNACGFSGADRNTFIAKKIDEQLGLVGFPELFSSVDWLLQLMEQKVVPVFSSVCRDTKGNLINVNADIFTNVLASSVNAHSVFFVSDVKGVILNGQFQKSLNKNSILDGIEKGEIKDGMIPKLKSCIELLEKGINKIWIGSGLSDDPDNYEKGGTWIVKSA